jgi:signal peptide peptidase SppA
MTMLLRIAERALNRPLMVHPDKLPLILGVLEGRLPIGDTEGWRREAEARIEALPAEARDVMRGPAPGASRFVGSEVDENPETGGALLLPYRRTADGVAVITVTGSLINRGAWLGSYSGETSYEGIQHQVKTAAADPRARAIVLDIESPGGEAVGAMETAAVVRAAAQAKPVTAVVNGMAASAAYALASGAREIVTTPSAISGSIGVVMLHADYSRFLDKKGITPTLIFAGAHKVDGHPFAPLPEGVRSDLQREVDQYYELFVETVTAGRRRLSPAAVRATEARIFIGGEAVEAGLADRVGTFEDVLADLSRGHAGRPISSQRRTSMTERNDGQPGAENPGNSVETISRSAHEAAVAKARAEGVAEGRRAETDRIAAILASDKLKGREKTALDLATKSTEMSAEAVVEFVAGLPAGAPTIADRMGGKGGDLAMGAPLGRPPAAVIDTAAIYDKWNGRAARR